MDKQALSRLHKVASGARILRRVDLEKRAQIDMSPEEISDLQRRVGIGALIGTSILGPAMYIRTKDDPDFKNEKLRYTLRGLGGGAVLGAAGGLLAHNGIEMVKDIKDLVAQIRGSK